MLTFLQEAFIIKDSESIHHHQAALRIDQRAISASLLIVT